MRFLLCLTRHLGLFVATLLLLLFAPTLHAQVIGNLAIQADVAIVRPGEPVRTFGGNGSTPESRGISYNVAIGQLKPGDLMLLGPGDFVTGMKTVTLPDQVTIRGAGKERTRVLSSAQYQTFDNKTPNSDGCAFESGNGTVLEDQTLEVANKSNSLQLVLLGFGQNRSSIRALTVRRCNLKSPEWVFYSWVDPAGNLFYAEQTDFFSACQCISACKSNDGAQFVWAERCRFYVDASKSSYEGAVRSPVYGVAAAVVCRGGIVKLFDCYAEIVGDNRMPRAAAITDWYSAGSTGTQIELHRFTCRVTGNGAKEVFDIDTRLGTVSVAHGSGSGAGGQFLVNITGTGRVVRLAGI